MQFVLPVNETIEGQKYFRIYNSTGYYITPSNNTTETLYINNNLSNIYNLSINSASLLINYIYFDINEKSFFINNKLTYIIEYVQYDNENDT